MLTDEQKTYVVQCLAVFQTPSVVVKGIKAEWGVAITPQAVECYDPTKRAGRALAKRWRALFEETRARFLEDTASVGIAHRVVRLATLQRLADRAESMGALKLAAEMCERAAKEMGGAYDRNGDEERGGVSVNVTINRLCGDDDG